MDEYLDEAIASNTQPNQLSATWSKSKSHSPSSGSACSRLTQPRPCQAQLPRVLNRRAPPLRHRRPAHGGARARQAEDGLMGRCSKVRRTCSWMGKGEGCICFWMCVLAGVKVYALSLTIIVPNDARCPHHHQHSGDATLSTRNESHQQTRVHPCRPLVPRSLRAHITPAAVERETRLP